MAIIPTEQTALIAREDGTLGLGHHVKVPELEDDMILVKNMAVALNPIDVKMVGKLATPGAVAGMDFAGEVVSIGCKVQTSVPIQIGDRVCGAVPGMHALTPSVGAFAQYVGVSDVVTMKIPDHLSFEEGASLGSGIGTIGQALFQSLQVPGTPDRPSEKPIQVLIYGGSTATGTLAIQLLKLSGLDPIATCSPHNFDLVKSYGASAVFDYHHRPASGSSNQTDAPEVAIKRHTGGSLRYVLDCISEPDTMQFCYRCLGRAGGKYTALEPFPAFLAETRKHTVTADWVLGPTLLGKPLGWPEPFARAGDPKDREFARWWFASAQRLLDEGILRMHPLMIVDETGVGGFAAVEEGLATLRKKQVSGQKLICRIE
ncbi:zinc-binding dehydrogenase family oxidoreductase [Colletotrichum tofieldiae]|uniref:Zinc-binding dehydrogenase family oxidoreductase n=1 Tax=Colletotrichum tofieldiae TaxID=708197 RepID=A0A166U1D9_9PEZI|nr:zinc-binding dehydrogenase family oxidoreductase [Colletotrichum tofieldiae]